MRKSPEKILRDPVHGDITIKIDKELEILDTPEIQRLRGIKQLGTANLVYPSAVHTRFEHSLGTFFLTQEMISAIEHQMDREIFSQEEKQLIRMAALIHDVSHIPFGHTFEDERQIFERHDSPDRFAWFLNQGKLAGLIRNFGMTIPLSHILNRTAENRAMSDIIGGTVCADLLDYLARDSYFCGISNRYDARILKYFRIENKELYIDCQKDGIIRQDVMSEVINLLRLRYFLSERVYFHHAKTASGAMISKAVELAVKNGLKKRDLYPLNDEGLLSMLEIKYSHIKPIGDIIENLRARNLYKRSYIITRKIGSVRQQELISKYHLQHGAREEAETVLTRQLRLKEGDLILYCPGSEMSLKEAYVKVKTDRSAPRELSSLKIPEIEVLLDKHRDLWKFYIFAAPGLKDRMKQISLACEEYFGEGNHLPALESGQAFFGF